MVYVTTEVANVTVLMANVSTFSDKRKHFIVKRSQLVYVLLNNEKIA